MIKIFLLNKNITWDELFEESWSSPEDSEHLSGTHLVAIENLELQSAETQSIGLLNTQAHEIKNRSRMKSISAKLTPSARTTNRNSINPRRQSLRRLQNRMMARRNTRCELQLRAMETLNLQVLPRNTRTQIHSLSLLQNFSSEERGRG